MDGHGRQGEREVTASVSTCLKKWVVRHPNISSSLFLSSFEANTCPLSCLKMCARMLALLRLCLCGNFNGRTTTAAEQAGLAGKTMGDLSGGVILISLLTRERCPSMPKLLHRCRRHSLSTSVSLTHFWHLMGRQETRHHKRARAAPNVNTLCSFSSVPPACLAFSPRDETVGWGIRSRRAYLSLFFSALAPPFL